MGILKEDYRARGLALTLFDYTDEDVERLKKIPTNYKIIGFEICPTTGRKHLQMFFYNKNKLSHNAFARIWNEMHIEKMKENSTPLDNRVYCSKDCEYYEEGDCPIQGRRNDLKIVNEVLKKTGKIRDLIDVIHNVQQLKYAETVIKYIEPKRNWKPNTFWFWGKTGTGKSKTAYEMFPDLHRQGCQMFPWWEGYDAHENVLIDDVKECTLKLYSYLLEVLDRYECRIQVKGGSRQLLAKNIIITSSFNPAELFSHFDDATELLRRIDEVKEFTIKKDVEKKPSIFDKK